MQWHVKEFAKLTDVTARTLHHYDTIGLLKPTIRQENGYRVYTEKDLLRLQQILALKFFGFDLTQIQNLLRRNQSLTDSFAVQVSLLQEKIKMLTQSCIGLQNILATEQDIDEMSWEKIIESMKVYKTMENLEKSWEGQILDQQELREYAQFEKDLQQRFSPEDEKKCEIQWQQIVTDIDNHLTESPFSQIGIKVAENCIEFLAAVYGKKYAHLSRIIWEKGFKTHKISDQYGMTPEMVSWLDQAIDGYYAQKIQKILLSIQGAVTVETKTAWQDLMDQMCGAHAQVTQKAIINQALFINDQYPVDQQLSPAAVKWLKSLL